MKAILISLVFILVILMGAPQIFAAEGNQVKYEEAVKAINEWIESIPKDSYKKASGEDIFKWKVSLEKAGGNPRFNPSKMYKAADQILKEIGVEKFEYNGYIYTKNSLNNLQLFIYIGAYEGSSDGNFSNENSPSDILNEKFSYYKKNITSKREQWEWLYGFMGFLSHNDSIFNQFYSPNQVDQNFIKKLATQNYTVSMEILRQYITLGKYFITNNPGGVFNSGRYYYKYQPEKWMDVPGTFIVLGRLYCFASSWSKYLKEEDKESILNFILPEYKENMFTIKIYTALN